MGQLASVEKRVERIAKPRQLAVGTQQIARSSKMYLSMAQSAVTSFGIIEAASRKAANAQIRDAKRAAREQERAARSAAQRQARIAQESARNYARAMGYGVTNAVRGIGNFAVNTLRTGGGMLVSSAISREMNVDKSLRTFANMATAPGGDRRRTYDQARAQATAVNQLYGTGRQAALGGAARFGEISGQYDLGVKLMPQFAKVAAATGSEISDVAATAGNAMMLLEQRGVKGGAALEELAKILDTLSAQGRVGAIEFNELAKETAKFVGSGGIFSEMAPTDIILTLGGVAQWSRKFGGAKSSAEAATSAARLVDAFGESQDKFKELGIDPFIRNKEGIATGLADPDKILSAIFGATGGDIEKVKGLFNIRAERAAMPFFARAHAISKEEKIPLEEAWRKTMAEFKDLVGAKWQKGEMEGAALFAAKGSGAQWERFVDDLAERFGPQLIGIMERLIPAFEKLLPTIEKIAEKLGEAVQWASENPEKGLLALGGGMLAKDLLATGLGAASTALLTRMLMGGAAALPGAVPGAVPGVPGAVPGATPGMAPLAFGFSSLASMAGGYFGYNYGSQAAFEGGLGEDAQTGFGLAHGALGTMNPLAAAAQWGLQRYAQPALYSALGGQTVQSGMTSALMGVAGGQQGPMGNVFGELLNQSQSAAGAHRALASAAREAATALQEVKGGQNRGEKPGDPGKR